jgi:hypothetical protein
LCDISNSKWIAVGSGINKLAYSNDGIIWNLVNTQLISNSVLGIGYNSYTKKLIMVGSGYNQIAYSTDIVTWTTINHNLFDECTDIDVDPTKNRWVIVGSGNNTLAYSDDDGVTWNGLGSYIFTTQGTSVKYYNNIWIATGSGTNTMAYSIDGITWIGLGKIIYTSIPDYNSNNYNGLINIANTKDVSNAIIYNMKTNDDINDSWYISKIRNINKNSKKYYVFVNKNNSNFIYSNDLYNWSQTSTTTFVNSGNGVSYNLLKNNKIVIPKNLLLSTCKGNINTLAYSYDSIKWYGLGKSIFDVSANCLKWNGKLWVAGGSGINTIAYSLYGDKNWIGLGKIFTNSCNSMDNDDFKFVAGGSGIHSIMYSTNGSSNWVGLGSSIFTQTNTIKWNGKLWIAGGYGNHTLAYSLYGSSNWIGLGNILFNQCNCVDSDGNIYVAVGSGNSSLAYSKNSVTDWISINNIFISGNKVSHNNNIWIAVGSGNNTIAWSNDGVVWNGLGNLVFSYEAYTIEWNGMFWIATGIDNINNNLSYSIAYSRNGMDWNKNDNSLFCDQIVWNRYKEGVYINEPNNKLYVNNNSLQLNTDNYYQSEYKNISVTLKSFITS